MLVSSPAPIVYCHCAYANVLPAAVKDEVLQRLVQSGVPFDAVADLCQLAAAKDPALSRMSACEGLRIVACFPRAVKSLFVAAGTPLPEPGAKILNMRAQPAEEIVGRLLEPTACDEESRP